VSATVALILFGIFYVFYLGLLWLFLDKEDKKRDR